MSHEITQLPSGVRLGFKIAKIVFQAATVAAAFCMVHEIHKVHRSIERREGKK
jgi:hypothetical protein